MIRVLMIEDDPEIARIIQYYLIQEDLYEISWAKSFSEALSLSRDNYDIILLDIMLPDGDGLALCTQLRTWHRCPIIFISCLDDSSTIVSALNSGGDDYIAKPFDNQILSAKIQANIRRVQMDQITQEQNIMACSGFSLNAQEHELIKGDSHELLSPMEFRILSFFMQHPMKPFKPNELYRLIWGKSCYGDHRTVVVHIHALRKKIEANPSSPLYLKSIWGKGYLFDPQGRES